MDEQRVRDWTLAIILTALALAFAGVIIAAAARLAVWLWPS
jgi:hypothetical protein